MSDSKELIEKAVWVSANNFAEETGGFAMLAGYWFEMMTLYGISNFAVAATERAKELGKDLIITVDEFGSNVVVNWKPVPKDADGR